MSISTSIIICSRNRAKLLQKTLLALQAPLAQAREAVEVIVVNNASTDDTDAVIAAARLPVAVRRVFAQTPGLSHARNAGVNAARGALLLWTDDDVSPTSGWLHCYEEARREWPDAMFFGGPVEPVLEGSPPDWLKETFDLVSHSFAAVDYGSEVFAITRVAQTPFGANFAVRTEVQRRYPYNPTLGRQPESYWLAGEETDVLSAILSAGGHGRWLPDARVQHRIPSSRQSRSSLLAYAIGNGRTQIRRQRVRDSQPIELTALRQTGTNALRRILRVLPYPLAGAHRRAIPDLYQAGTAIGQWLELCRVYQSSSGSRKSEGV